MDIQGYRKELLEEVRSLAESESNSRANTFVKVFCDDLMEIDVLEDYNQCFISVQGKNNRKLVSDAYHYNAFDKTLTIIATDFIDDDQEHIITRSEAQKIFNRMQYLIEEILDARLLKKFDISCPQYDFVHDIYINKESIRRIKLTIISDGVMSDRMGIFESTVLSSIPIEYSIWDVGRLFKTYVSSMGREELEIDFTEYSDKGIPLLYANSGENKYKSYLGVIQGDILADIYDKYGSRLLEGNVRSFLSTKGSVNKKIRKTILANPEMFFPYNNGISATAKKLEYENLDNVIYLKRAVDFQIVNGGQTTASLSTARFKDKANLKDVYVQLKLTEVDNDVAEDIIPEISRCSNSQNKVSEADFFSTSPFHVRMEEISRRLYAPAVGGAQNDTHWFYERARGQYIQSQLKMTQAQKNRFKTQNPKSQLITKTDCAKYINSWGGLPYFVSRGAQTNFISFAQDINPKWQENNEIFNDNYYKELVAKAILFKHIETLVSNQTWYQNAYRANIVTYSISLFSYILKKQYKSYSFDFIHIWNKQSIPYEINQIFIDITKLIFDCMTAPGKVTMNVTQWCKKEIAWNDIKNTEYVLPISIEKFLISLSEDKKYKLDCKKQQKLNNEIECQITVANLGEKYWNKAIVFGRKNKLLSKQDENVLSLVSNLNSNKFPNYIQCNYLLNILQKLKEEGFVD